VYFFSVGGSCWIAYKTIRARGSKALNALLILPLITLVTTICYILIMINILTFGPQLSADTLSGLYLTQATRYALCYLPHGRVLLTASYRFERCARGEYISKKF
jgi:hypothetical protein